MACLPCCCLSGVAFAWVVERDDGKMGFLTEGLDAAEVWLQGMVDDDDN